MAIVTVKLRKPHTHAGQRYPVGAELAVSPLDAKFLLRAGVIDKVPAATQRSVERKETANV